MKVKYNKLFSLHTICLIGLLSFVFITEKDTQAQHSGGGIIDTTRQPGDKAPSFHQSFAPYGGTVPIPWIDEKPTAVSIKVTDIITYEIPVDEKKFTENKLSFNDLELKEVKNSSEINFHQVDCYFFKVIKQTQVRKAEGLTCSREREGTQYWLSDGKKYIEWGKWSNWQRKKQGEDEAEIVGN
ncbi:MAG: hypothetical protein FJ264_01550 [Planctomycetes bacterium]|nr:hypothetical protein [Planctomycetota bacterium]